MKDDVVGYIATGVNAVMTATQAEEVFMWIQLGITILTFLVSLAYTIYRWYRKAKSDGKISIDEVEDLIEEIADEVDELKEKIDSKEE